MVFSTQEIKLMLIDVNEMMSYKAELGNLGLNKYDVILWLLIVSIYCTLLGMQR